jgi:hypothetical protein
MRVVTPTQRIVLEPSSGLSGRAQALGAYLSDLHGTLEQELHALDLETNLQPVTLRVLTEADWAKSLPYPYGFTFYRRLKNGDGVIFAPSDYPSRLLWVFKAVIVRAEMNGARAPGNVEEFLDLTLGHELGHALADQLELRTRVRWLDEFLATYLYLAALRTAMPDAYNRVLSWGRVFSSAKLDDCALGDANLLMPSGNRKRKAATRQTRLEDADLRRTDLGAFEYPLVRLPLANQAWYQARFTLHAADLLERRGLEFVLAAMDALPKSSGRGGVTRSVMKLEPSFKAWFASFGVAA